MKRLALGIILALLISSMLALAFCVHALNASGAVYIRADGSIDPPAAPIQRNGDVYTLTGNIISDSDGIVVERDDIVVDGSGFTVDGAYAYLSHGIYLDGRSNMTIQNTNITSFWYGIALNSSSSNSINGNTITNNYDGVWLGSSSNNSINGNTITNNSWRGIDLGPSSDYNSIGGNDITNSGDVGVWLTGSSSNSIDGNTMTNNYYGGIWLGSSSDYNSISENTITNTDGEGIGLSYSSNNSINGNTIANNNVGIWLGYSSNNSINGNTITNNGYGIELAYSSNNTVCHDNFIDNTVQVNNATPSNTNFWDNGCEGDYWSNYNGTDLNDDGVGGTYLPWEGVDSYPLMHVYWNPCDINHDLKVDMKDIWKSAGAYGNRVGGALWNPHADISGPEPLVPDGKVDMRDISLVARHFGDHYP